MREPRFQNHGAQPTRRYAWEERNQNVQPVQQHQQNTQFSSTIAGRSSATAARSDQVSLGLHNQPATTDQSDRVKFGLYNQTNTSGQNRMEVDESPGSGGAVVSLTKTAELFTTLQSLSSLMPGSKREITALELAASAKVSIFFSIQCRIQ